jgi:CRP-like cAMP-binding protein
VGFYSFTIGTLSSILSTIDIKKQKLLDKLVALHSFSKKIELEESMQLKIKRIFEHNYENMILDEEFILQDLPADLRGQILIKAHGKIFDKINFFQNKEQSFILGLLNILKPIHLESNDIVYRENDLADNIYFIQKGRVRFCTNEGYIFKVFVEGSYFGDTEILKERKRMCNVLTGSKEDCELVSINKTDFLNILKTFPIYDQEFRKLAEERELKNLEAARLAKLSNYRLPRKKVIELMKGRDALIQESSPKNDLSYSIISQNTSPVHGLHRSKTKRLKRKKNKKWRKKKSSDNSCISESEISKDLKSLKEYSENEIKLSLSEDESTIRNTEGPLWKPPEKQIHFQSHNQDTSFSQQDSFQFGNSQIYYSKSNQAATKLNFIQNQ